MEIPYEKKTLSIVDVSKKYFSLVRENSNSQHFNSYSCTEKKIT